MSTKSSMTTMWHSFPHTLDIGKASASFLWEYYNQLSYFGYWEVINIIYLMMKIIMMLTMTNIVIVNQCIHFLGTSRTSLLTTPKSNLSWLTVSLRWVWFLTYCLIDCSNIDSCHIWNCIISPGDPGISKIVRLSIFLDYCVCCSLFIYLSLMKISRRPWLEPGCHPLSGWAPSPSWSYKSKLLSFMILQRYILGIQKTIIQR